MKPARPKRTRLRRAGKSKRLGLSDEKRAALEERLRYVFKDKTLIDTAMTHPSALSKNDTPAHSNQRLEFLGDRVLALVMSERLFARHPNEQEGALAPKFNGLVNKTACASAAQRMGLGDYIMLGVSERESDGVRKTRILGDLCEAVIAALYLDGGMKPARAFIERAWAEQFANPPTRVKDAKSLLQEWAQARGYDVPKYETISRSGPDHAPVFKVRVTAGPTATETADGKSKQDAERAAATALLDILEKKQK